MQKIALTIAVACTLLLIGGCQGVQDEAQKLRQQTEKAVQDASQQVEDAKKQVIDTKAQIDEKVKEAQDVADAVKKFSE